MASRWRSAPTSASSPSRSPSSACRWWRCPCRSRAACRSACRSSPTTTRRRPRCAWRVISTSSAWRALPPPEETLETGQVALKRMDNVGIVGEARGGAIDSFRELGLDLEGRATIEGEWAGRVTGLGDQHVEIAMMRTPDGHGRLELSRFLRPAVVADHRNAPVNALGYLRVMFAVDDLDETLARLSKRGAQVVGEVVQYQASYRLCYIRGPEGILIGLAQELT